MPYTNPAQLPFVSDPHDASRDAAIRAEAFSGAQLRAYLNFLIGKGPDGATDREAEEQIPMRRSSVCARRSELVKHGMVIATGQRRRGCGAWKVVTP